MIKKIKIKNFKSLKDISIETSNLNLFTGINGVGKSSFIQVLLLLRQSYTKNKLILNGNLTEIGSVKDALCESRETDNMQFSFEYEYKEEFILEKNYHFNYNKKSDNYFTSNNIIEEDSLALFQINRFQYLNAERLGPRIYNDTDFEKISNKQIGIHGEYAINYLYENQNKDISIINLAKKIDIRLVDGKIKNDNSLISQLEAWLREISPDIVAKPKWYQELNKVSSFFAFKQERKPDTNSFKSSNIGFGISYILPVVLAILIANKDDIVIIENPEAHLHPKGQTVLGELMSIAAQNGVQLFIETHSDHIFDGIRIATKEKKINPEKYNILFFDRDEKEHITKITKIEIDNNGRYMKEPPKGFFDEFEINMMKLL